MTNLLTSNQIKPDATLDELKMTKQGWLDMARQAGYPEICWQIVRWLGKLVAKNVSVTAGNTRLWQSGNVAIVGNEYAEKFDVARNAYRFARFFTVWVRNAGAQKTYKDEMDNIVMNSVPVMYWGWELFYDKETMAEEIFRVDSSCFFVNGSWILSVRDFIGQAQAKKEAYNLANTDLERKRLMEELLVGVSV